MKRFISRLTNEKKGAGTLQAGLPPLQLHNTLSGKLEVFTSLVPGQVKMYNCGPTAYDRQTVGNLLPPVIFNVLRNTLEYWGYEVRQVNNITDVGHLTSDADEGEDKMSRGLAREGVPLTLENMRLLAEKYAAAYFEDIQALGIPLEKIAFPRASDYIPEDVALVETLVEKGYAYVAADGVYFDVSRFPSYGKLGAIDLAGLREGARTGTHAGKHTPFDFALWKFDPHVGWESPWGRGFPGWHIECSAMIFKLLGRQIDIHTGGIEHIPVHHNNEIAQAEAASGKKFVQYWLHNSHITIEGAKISKSQGNVAYLSDITNRGLSAPSLRYWFLTAHYRTQANFTWDALEGAAAALRRLTKIFQELPPAPDALPDPPFMHEFLGHIANDLDTPQALARIWDLVRNQTLPPEVKRASLLEADAILGLKFAAMPVEAYIPLEEVPEHIQTLLEQRERARAEKDYSASDAIRDRLKSAGFDVSDTPDGQKLIRG